MQKEILWQLILSRARVGMDALQNRWRTSDGRGHCIAMNSSTYINFMHDLAWFIKDGVINILRRNDVSELRVMGRQTQHKKGCGLIRACVLVFEFRKYDGNPVPRRPEFRHSRIYPRRAHAPVDFALRADFTLSSCELETYKITNVLGAQTTLKTIKQNLTRTQHILPYS